MRKGVVVNIEATLKAVSSAIEAAEMMAGREVHECWTGIGGSHVDGINSRGVVAISGKKRETREIANEDIIRVIEAARAVVIPMDRQILEVIPQSFTVDDQKGIRDPLDMIGVRLESEVHIITCSVTSAQNLVKCVNLAGFRVNGLVLQSLATGKAALAQEEKDMGVVLIDLGGGTTNVLVYQNGAPYSTCTIPVGGSQVTGDLSIIKNIPFETAEKIKIESGCCWEPLLEDDDEILVQGVAGRPPLKIPHSQIYAIIRPRMEEIFKMVKQKLEGLSLSRPLGGGVVLSGGGARLAGAVELAGDILKLPARVGVPVRFPGLEGLVDEYRRPDYATVIGLMLLAAERSGEIQNRIADSAEPDRKQPNLLKRFKNWIKNEFF
jgi:cell division protein FtsA